jgi:hypothetical protein
MLMGKGELLVVMIEMAITHTDIYTYVWKTVAVECFPGGLPRLTARWLLHNHCRIGLSSDW